MNRARTIVHADAAHHLGVHGDGIGIAIVDTGLSPHPDYRTRITGWYDAVSRKKRPYDDSGHGSHVAGIAAGNGFISHGLYSGIAPGADIIGIKVLNRQGSGYIASMMRGLNWILYQKNRLRIRIVNISIGANDYRNYSEESPFVKKVDELWDNGIVVVAAAGNLGPKPQTITAPGNSRKIITVGCSDGLGTLPLQPPDKKESHSGTGPTLCCIKKPDVVAPGSQIISCSSVNLPQPSRRGYAKRSGTSMSTPIVSGAIALLLSLHPDMTPKDVKIKLRDTCTDLGLPHEKQGWGLLDIDALL